MSANEIQHGGDHYKNSEGVQHWDWVTGNFGLGYLAGCATKYVSRWRNKNGLEDLKKAEHYVQKMIECADQGFTNPLQGWCPTQELTDAYGLTNLEHSVCDVILQWQETHHLEAALAGIRHLQLLAGQGASQLPPEHPDAFLEGIRQEVAEQFGVPVEQVQVMHMQSSEPVDGMEFPFGYDPDEEEFQVVDDDDDFDDLAEPAPMFSSRRQTVGQLSTEQTDANGNVTMITVEGNLVINLQG